MAPSIRTARPVWPRHDFMELLAHLDAIVEASHPRTFSTHEAERYQQDILHQLRQKLHNRYSAAQIKTKLWDEIRKGYKYPDANFFQLFVHGSSEIPTLDDETRQRVGEQCASIRYIASTTRLINSSPQNPGSTLRRKTIGSTKLGDDFKVQKYRSKPRRPTPLIVYNRVTRSASCIRVKSELASTCDENEHTLSRPANESVTASKTTANKMPREYALREVRSSTETSISPELDSMETLASDLPGKPKGNDGTSTASSSFRSTPSPVQPAMSIGATEIDDLQWNLTYFQNRCRELEEACARSQLFVRQTQSIYAKTKGVPDKLKEELDKMILDNLALNKKLDNRSRFRPYLALDTVHGQAPNARKIYDAFKDFRSKLGNLLVIPGVRMPDAASIRNIKSKSDLGSLFTTIVGKELQKNDMRPVKSLFNVSVNVLLQALTSAAVCVWVFDQKVRCIEVTTTPLLEEYRSCIESTCGEDALSRLDLAAHQSLFEKEHFDEVTLPRMASKHTDRLLEALHLLIDHKKRSSATSELRLILFAIFSRAVKAKCLSMIGKLQYEFIWPPCLAQFDNRFMETKAALLSGPAITVKIPLVPGFRIATDGRKVAQRQHMAGESSSMETEAIVAKALVMV